MAYKPIHKETEEYRTNDIKIKNFFKNLKKLQMEIENFCEDAEITELSETTIKSKMLQLFGTKRYKGKEIKLINQWQLYKSFNKLMQLKF